MTLEQRGACEMLRSANDYLHNKSFSGDNARKYMQPDQWFSNTMDAIIAIKECISEIKLEDYACPTK